MNRVEWPDYEGQGSGPIRAAQEHRRDSPVCKRGLFTPGLQATPRCTDLLGYQQSNNVALVALTSHVDLQSLLASSSPIAQIRLPDNGGAAN